MKAVNVFFLLLAVACGPEVLAQDAGGDCLVAPEAGDLGDGVRAIEPVEAGRDANRNANRHDKVRISCRAGRVSGVSIRLSPGGSAQARIVLVGGSDHAASLAAEGGLPKEWSGLSARRINARTTVVTISITAPDQAEVGSAFSDRLSVTRAGLEFDIPINLEILDDGPLFRDEFDNVDPVIGQFSVILRADRSLYQT